MNVTEVLGFLFGVVGVYLQLKENKWTFPIGLINVTLSLFLFFEQGLFADALQQLVYIVLLIYGWYKWVHPDLHQVNRPISTCSPFLRWRLLLTGTVFACTLGYILHRYTPASLPWLDSTATAASFVAQWLVAQKKLENWLIWIPVNLVYIGIYLYKDLPLYAVLFSIYLLLAIWGYMTWRNKLHHEAKTI